MCDRTVIGRLRVTRGKLVEHRSGAGAEHIAPLLVLEQDLDHMLQPWYTAWGRDGVRPADRRDNDQTHQREPARSEESTNEQAAHRVQTIVANRIDAAAEGSAATA